MKTLKHNGEHWYLDKRSAFKRARQWFAWFGGWEKSNGAGWQFRIPTTIAVDGGFGYRWRYLRPVPISLLGHRITVFNWGAQCRLPGGVLVWSRHAKTRRGYCYFSRNGTPQGARRWFWGWEEYFGTDRVDRLEDPI